MEWMWICILVTGTWCAIGVQSQECASSQADIVFVVDDSTSVQRTNYRLVLGFIQDLVRTLTIGPDAVQVGFLSFSNTMKSQFYFKTFSDKDQLINKIGAVKFRGGGTNIARALSEAYQKHFQDPSTGGRDAAVKVLVLITDGASEGTEQISQTIRDAGIKILCVGITSGVDLQQLRDIAGNEERVFKASTFRTLGDIAGNLITKTCEATQPEVLDPCKEMPCQNNGTCLQDGNGGFTCRCRETFTGNTCEIELDACEPNPCLNGGTCTSTTDSFSCTCAAQFTGVTCQIEIPPAPCTPNPCLHGGTCSESTDGFICSCIPGFTGEICEEETSQCIPNPCVNGGSCMESGNKYVCSCTEDYEGDKCEIGKVKLLVAEIGGEADALCHNDPTGIPSFLEITNITIERLDRRASNHIIIKNIEKQDAYSTLLCHYNSTIANTTRSLPMSLIVVEKKKEEAESATQFTCSIYANIKDVNVSIQAEGMVPIYSGDFADTASPIFNMLGTGNLKPTNYLTGASSKVPSYNAFQSKSVSTNVYNKGTNVVCSVLYNDKVVWTVKFPDRKEEHRIDDEEGYPVVAWILLGVLIFGIIVAVIVFATCKRRCIAARKSRPKSRETREHESELANLRKTENLDDKDIENEADDSNMPLKTVL